MTTTQNLHLPQWEASDRIHHDDFNDAFAAIDTAVAANSTAIADKASTAALSAETRARQNADAALQSAVAQCGNCHIVAYTYTGNGNATHTVTFAKKPLFVFLIPAETSAERVFLNIVRGATSVQSQRQVNDSVCELTWSGNSLTLSARGPYAVMNAASTTYCCLALLTDE